jgi:hypothetical protein
MRGEYYIKLTEPLLQSTRLEFTIYGNSFPLYLAFFLKHFLKLFLNTENK